MKKYFSYILIFSILLAACKSSKTLTLSDDSGKSSSKNINKVSAQRVFLEAEKAFVAGDIELAISLYKEAVHQDPKNDAAYYQMARIFHAGQDFKNATDLIERAVKISPDNLWYNLFAAEIYATGGDFKTAENYYDKVIKLNPQELTYRFDKAYIQGQAENYEGAIKTLNEIEAILGKNEAITGQKVALYLSANKIDAAANELQKVIDEEPGNEKNYMTLAQIYQANGETDKASAVYQKLLKINPENIPALLFVADQKRLSGNDTDYLNFIGELIDNKALGIDPKIGILYSLLEEYRRGTRKTLIPVFPLVEKLKTNYPDDAKSFAMSGDFYNINDNKEEAVTDYKKSLTLRTDVFTVWKQLFVLMNDLKQYDELIEKTHEAAELYPTNGLVYFFEGLALSQKKEYKDAVNPYGKAYKMSAGDVPLRAQILGNLAENYHNMELHQKSDSCFEESIRLDDENAYILNNFSYYLSLRKEKLQIAKEYSALSNKLVVNNSSFLDTYAWVLFQLGDYNEAEKYQQKAIDAAGANERATLLEHYGDILIMLNKKDKAQEYWEKAKNLGANSPTLDRKISDLKYYEE